MNKVLLLSHMPPPTTGIGSWTKKLLKLGMGPDWEIVLVNTNTINGRDPFKNEKRNIKDEWTRCSNIWRQERAYLKNDKEGEIKVVHTCIPCTLFGMMREIVSGAIAKHYGRKYILHCRCTVSNVVNTRMKQFVFRWLAAYCDGIIVLNKRSEEFAKHNSHSEVVLIPNFAEKSTMEFNINQNEKKSKFENLVFVGGVTKDKGCDLIIEAAKELPDIKFHLIGIVSDEIKNMSKTDNVILYGNKNNAFVKEFLNTADGFLFLSRYWGEGFSNALVEAMAAGLPCIVTDWAANADMVGNEGGVVIGNSAEQLIEAISKLQRDELFRIQAGSRNVKKVLSSYVDEVVIPQYTEFYEQLLKVGKK